MWLDEWGIGTDDDELSGTAPSRTLRRTWSEEVDALETVDTTPPKRRKSVDEEDMEAFLAELEADGDYAPSDKDTDDEEDMPVASRTTHSVAQVPPSEKETTPRATSTRPTTPVRNVRPPPASDGQSVKKSRKQTRVLKTTRHCVISRAYKAAKRTALAERKSKEEAGVLARAALKQAGIEWNEKNL